ncbi:hypothetical protein BWQ93_05780 [Sphingopyxis sp. QXT-31]|uniref:hypothetical protein n=1 Tax=Sphingopyxis sp. QXT-31 TaxID=1357916 RepID=UPI0009796194|nr:hypothetical protein [Sphingopyxis sp. QXT-31]APZ98042.1 hypothetical protein BWQ93_05780 [Sphingopyxis sp. QXT-31]
MSAKPLRPIAELLHEWQFNVALECRGAPPGEMKLALGGAVLELHDLDRVLCWAAEQAVAALPDPDEATGCVDDAKAGGAGAWRSAVGADEC